MCRLSIEEMLEMLDEPVPPWDTERRETKTYIAHEPQISKANEIFGVWSYQTNHLISEKIECYTSKDNKEMVRVTNLVQVDSETPIGKKSGRGEHTSFGSISNIGEVRGNSFKAAETDALKRSLVNCGWALGLCLYNKTYLQALQSEDWRLFSPTHLKKLAEDYESNRALLEKAHNLCRTRFERYALPIINKKKTELVPVGGDI